MNATHMKGISNSGIGHRQNGLSMLELLIGITIGLMVSVAAVGSLVYSRVSATTVGDSSRLYQDAAVAFRAIGYQIRQGGARRLVSTGGNVEFNPSYVGFGSGSSTVVVTGVNGTSTITETLRISFDTTPGFIVTDCLGQTSTLANNVSSTFSVSAGALTCGGSGSTTGQWQLIQGVEDFQVWYGRRDPSDDSFRYFTADAVPFWDQVESVMICLRLAGELSNNPTVASTGCSGEAVPGDGRIRRVFRRVFNIRNLGV